MLTREDIELLTELKLSIHRALWGEVIPSLRAVRLEWEPGCKEAYVIFYHNGEVTPTVEDHYSCILAEAAADFAEPNLDMKIIRSDYPSLFSKEQYMIYARKEPFVDPI
jgi:hypothetical protein